MNIRPFPLGRGQFLAPHGSTAVMGIINVTPDSFSDGGRIQDADDAVAAGRRMKEEGATILDVGGESTRPGAQETPLDEELRRVVPVVKALVERVGLPVSIDTRKAAVFQEAWAAGASMLNDTSALAHDPEMAKAAGATDAAVVLMHMRGTPATMDDEAHYRDPIGEVRQELTTALDRAFAADISPEHVILDPGIGFAKTTTHSLTLLRNLDALRLDGYPLLVGPSRKRLLAEATRQAHPANRDVATAALVALLARRGVEMVRVHAVGAAVHAIAVSNSLERPDLRAGEASSAGEAS